MYCQYKNNRELYRVKHQTQNKNLAIETEKVVRLSCT